MKRNIQAQLDESIAVLDAALGSTPTRPLQRPLMKKGECLAQSTIDSEGFKGGTRGAPIMPRDAVSRTANVERTVRH